MRKLGWFFVAGFLGLCTVGCGHSNQKVPTTRGDCHANARQAAVATVRADSTIHEIAGGGDFSVSITRVQPKYHDVDLDVRLKRRVNVNMDLPFEIMGLRQKWHLTARNVPSLSVTVKTFRCNVAYIRPAWDAGGAHLIEQHWVGKQHAFLPGGG